MNPEIMPYEALAKELMRRCMADDDPESIRVWLNGKLAHLGGGDESALMTWPASFDQTDELVSKYETMAGIPEKERKLLTWPWRSWNNLIDPLEDGMLGVVTAPDGAGKTIYAESIAEHWAKSKNRVLFVHYELNRNLMLMRRMARHTGILVRAIKGGHLSSEQKQKIADVRLELLQWEGYISYLHTPGWSMERTTAELRRLQAEGECDAVIVDYLEKASASERQMKMFGPNTYQREADNVEQLKIFSESTGVPVLMLAQMSKEGKGEKFQKMDRTGMRGAGEKSDKANLVVMLKRERMDEGYSNTVEVLVDKNTMGGCGCFTQEMQPEFFRVADPYQVRI